MNIAVFGLKRSGQHPIINWICRQLPGVTVHYNNIHKAGFDPHERCSQMVIYRNGPHESECRKASSTEYAEPPMERDHIVHTYEDFQLQYLESHGYYKRFKDARPIEILILRDPYNWAASRIKSGRNANLSLWLQYAREFVGETSFLRFSKVLISFNEWFLSRVYRDTWLLDNLGIENHDRGVDSVSALGNGSSFDSTEFDGRAQEMKVLDRWKEIKPNKLSGFMQKLRKNPQVLEYAKMIFQMDFPS